MIKKTLCYIASFALIILYVWIIFEGTNIDDKVSLEYKMFYVDKVLAFWPGENGLDYELGDVIKCGIKIPIENRVLRISRTGWVKYMGSYKAYGEDAKIYFSGLPKKDLTLNLKVFNEYENNEIEIFANGVSIGEFSPILQDSWNSMIISKELIDESGFLEIGLVLDDTNCIELKELVILD